MHLRHCVGFTPHQGRASSADQSEHEACGCVPTLLIGNVMIGASDNSDLRLTHQNFVME